MTGRHSSTYSHRLVSQKPKEEKVFYLPKTRNKPNFIHMLTGKLITELQTRMFSPS
jgi:hypothetical protein